MVGWQVGWLFGLVAALYALVAYALRFVSCVAGLSDCFLAGVLAVRVAIYNVVFVSWSSDSSMSYSVMAV